MSDAHDRVGPVLEAGDVGRAIVAAIQSLGPDVLIQDRGSYLRVLAPGRCRVTRLAIERQLGREFQLPGELELVMPSFKGAFHVNDDEAVWEAVHT